MDQEFLDKAKQLMIQSECLPILINFVSQRANAGDEEAREALDRWDEYRKKCYEEVGRP